MSETGTSSGAATNASGEDLESQELQLLTDFVLSNELSRLERRLGGFNLFHTLGLANKELAHARLLAWMLQPDEAHGLGELFLRRWLMRVVSDAENADSKLPTTPEVEAVDWVQMEVETEVSMSREDRLDVVLKLRERTREGGREPLWIVAVEMKVDSEEGEEQLPRYTQILSKRFHDAERRVLVYLTKGEQDPSDPAWIRCGFATVLSALRDCLLQRADTIGPGPKLLLENYRNLLEEEFVTNSKVANAVQRIIKTHPEAVELILKHKTDPLQEWTRELRNKLTTAAAELGIQVKEGAGRDYIEFAAAIWKPNPKLKKAAVLCVLRIEESGVGLRIYATYHCETELKQRLVELAERHKDVFLKGTARKEQANEPTLESEWWHDFSEGKKDADAVLATLSADLKVGRLHKVINHIAEAMKASPTQTATLVPATADK